MRESLVLLAVLVAASTLAVMARRSTSAEPRSVTRVTDDRVVVGVVVALSGRPDPRDRLLLRGLQLWHTRVGDQGGIPYQPAGRKAAVSLQVADSHGTERGAANAAADLLRRGARVLIGPSSVDGTAAVAGKARGGGALFLGSDRRPLHVPADSLSRFLTRPLLGDFSGALDAFTASRPPPRHPADVRVVVISPFGGWGIRARRTMELVRARGYTARLVRLRAPSDLGPTRRAAAASNPDIILLSTPYGTARRLAHTPLFGGAQLVAAPAQQIEQLAAPPPPRELVVVLPWTPSQGQGGPTFPPGQLRSAYSDAYGASPPYPVAAGASLGELLSASINRTQSTDMTRVARGIDQLVVGSPAGLLQFKNGNQVQPGSAAVIARPSGPPRHLWPRPAAPGYVQGRLTPRPTGRSSP